MINDNKLTECQICFERYNKNNKEPKILSCGHTFCKECLMKFQANVKEIISLFVGTKNVKKKLKNYLLIE